MATEDPGTVCTNWPPYLIHRHWRFGRRNAERGGRETAWCVSCGMLLEVQEEGTGRVIWDAFPHRRPA